MAAQPLVTLGRYILERRVAMGGMAEVFLGRIEGPGDFAKPVVIKRIHPHLRTDARIHDMFIDEARLAARLNHPNLVQTYEFARVGTDYILVMEFVRGNSLARIIERARALSRTIPVNVALAITVAVAEGLHYAHELTSDRGRPLNVVHRDICPANVMVTTYGQVKIVDFGIAAHEERRLEARVTGLKSGVSYMSPEQSRGESLDRRSDIFSLGCVLYEMLTAEPCFEADSVQHAAERLTRMSYVPLSDLRPDLSPGVLTVAGRMLSGDRGERFQTAAEVAEAFRSLEEGTGIARPEQVVELVDALRGVGAGSGDDDTEVTDELSVPFSDAGRVQLTGELARPNVVLDEAGVAAALDIPPPPRRGSVGVEFRERRRSFGGWALGTLVAAAVAGVALWLVTGPLGPSLGTSSVPVAPPPVVEAPSPEPPPPEPAVAMGRLSLTLTPSADIYLGEELLGTSPLQNVRVPAGAHALRVVNTDANLDTRVSVTVPEGESISTRIVLRKGALRVKSRTPVEVFIGERFVGTTPLRDVALHEGSYQVRLVNERKDFEQTHDIVIRPGRVTRLSLRVK